MDGLGTPGLGMGTPTSGGEVGRSICADVGVSFSWALVRFELHTQKSARVCTCAQMKVHVPTVTCVDVWHCAPVPTLNMRRL